MLSALQAPDGGIRNLDQLLEESPNPMLRVARDGTLLYANRESWLLLSHWRTDLGAQVPSEWIAFIQEALATGQEKEAELSIGVKTLTVVIVPVSNRGYANLYGLDATRRRQVEEKLRLDVQVFENATEGIMICDAELRIVDVNQAYCAITGIRARKAWVSL